MVCNGRWLRTFWLKPPGVAKREQIVLKVIALMVRCARKPDISSEIANNIRPSWSKENGLRTFPTKLHYAIAESMVSKVKTTQRTENPSPSIVRIISCEQLQLVADL